MLLLPTANDPHSNTLFRNIIIGDPSFCPLERYTAVIYKIWFDVVVLFWSGLGKFQQLVITAVLNKNLKISLNQSLTILPS